jgi:hypothetical protein
MPFEPLRRNTLAIAILDFLPKKFDLQLNMFNIGSLDVVRIEQHDQE